MSRTIPFNSAGFFNEECVCGCDAFTIIEYGLENEVKVRCANCKKLFAKYFLKEVSQ